MTIPLIERARRHAGRTAVVDTAGQHAYGDLLDATESVARTLLAGRSDLGEARIAFVAGPGLEYVATLLGIWEAGGVAVPLAPTHPRPEIEFVLDDTRAEGLVADRANEMRVRLLAQARDIWLVHAADALAGIKTADRAATLRLPDIGDPRRAMILYTSGTTSRPKGVVTTHRNLCAQIESLVEAWRWSADDRILHVLPLHHTHGIVNALLCALWVGATCEMMPAFDARRVWERLCGGERVTLFMAVPTIYAKLIAEWESGTPADRERWSRGARGLRLMVSGSAALPVSVFERWREITGHTLLERYGMTEIGMALSNPIDGERRPGTVGGPLPGVEVQLRDDNGHLVTDGTPGELHVRGAGVFLEYWNRPESTRSAFRDDWFRTGDVATLEDGYYRILGRSSVDIIKTGGYKVSALEIEEALRAHPAVRDCAVVGIEDSEWGERVAAAIVPDSSTSSDSAESLKEWLGERIASYKVPRRWRFVDDLPRNSMGKVVKVAVKKLFEG